MLREKWNSLFESIEPNLTLSFEKPDSTHHGSVAKLSKDDMAEERWKNTLVGYFIGIKPQISVVRTELTNAWRSQHGVLFANLGKGFIMFKFQNPEECQRLLEKGPWFLFGHPLILERESALLNYQKEEIKSMPAWVKFSNLNLSCYTQGALSKIASCIGIPICMDKPTSMGTRPSFARVLIEISAGELLPDIVKYSYEGDIMEQVVEYVWKPAACSCYHIFNISYQILPEAT